MPDIFDSINEMLKKGEDELVLHNILIDGGVSEVFCKDESDMNRALYIVGDIWYRRKKLKVAINYFKRALLYSSGDAEAMWAIGDCYSELGNPYLAGVWYKKSFSRIGKKNKNNLLYNMANAYFDQKKYKRAVVTYKLISGKYRKVFALAKKNIETILTIQTRL